MNYEGLIPILGGLYAALLGFGIMRPGSNDERNRAWLSRWGTFMKICGPVLVCFGVAELLKVL